MKTTLSRLLRARRLVGALAALLILALGGAISFGPVSALVVDQTRIMSQRFYNTDQPIYYRLTINYNDPNISTGQQFGALQKNSFIKAIDCHVTTAFNGGITNYVTIGTTKANADEIVAETTASGSITANSATVQHLTSALGLGLALTSAADVTLYAKYLSAGTAPTAGSVTCVLEFVLNNDL